MILNASWLILNITTILLIIIYLTLSFYVIKQRHHTKKFLGGTHENSELTAAIQAHGNFSQYTPFALFLFLLLTLERISPFWLTLLCVMFLLGRCLHIYSMLVVEKRSPRSFKYRVRGMKLTFFTLIFASFSSLIWILFQLY